MFYILRRLTPKDITTTVFCFPAFVSFSVWAPDEVMWQALQRKKEKEKKETEAFGRNPYI